MDRNVHGSSPGRSQSPGTARKWSTNKRYTLSLSKIATSDKAVLFCKKKATRGVTTPGRCSKTAHQESPLLGNGLHPNPWRSSRCNTKTHRFVKNMNMLETGGMTNSRRRIVETGVFRVLWSKEATNIDIVDLVSASLRIYTINGPTLLKVLPQLDCVTHHVYDNFTKTEIYLVSTMTC